MIKATKAILRSKGYKLFQRPFELNIVGFRANSVRANAFDDTIDVFYRDDASNWKYWQFEATTDPGTFWLENPQHPKGTAILSEGQYVDAYGLGLHAGKYEALAQLHKPVTVLRDYDRDAFLDFSNGTRDNGMHGINIHRANANGTTDRIDKHSAGCQVFKHAKDYRAFLAMCKIHRARYGNTFTYTLIDERARKRLSRKRTVFGVALFGLTVAGLSLLGEETEAPAHPLDLFQ